MHFYKTYTYMYMYMYTYYIRVHLYKLVLNMAEALTVIL